MIHFTTDLLDTSQLPKTAVMAIEFGFKLLNCALVVVFGLIAIYVLKKLIAKFFKASKKKFPENNYDTAETVLKSIVKYAVYLYMFFQILPIFGASMESLLAVAGVGSIALGFGARTIAEDFITGTSILFENQFRVGDSVSINDKSGTVESIGLRITTIRSLDGDLHIFPNSTIRLVTNMSKSFNRVMLEIPVSYAEDIDRVLDILSDEINRAKSQFDAFISDPVVQGIIEMNASAVVVRVIADCKVGENWRMERELRRLIKNRFDKEGVLPPYPHQVFHADGGESIQQKKG